VFIIKEFGIGIGIIGHLGGVVNIGIIHTIGSALVTVGDQYGGCGIIHGGIGIKDGIILIGIVVGIGDGILIIVIGFQDVGGGIGGGKYFLFLLLYKKKYFFQKIL
jgi:hypothetical protein